MEREPEELTDELKAKLMEIKPGDVLRYYQNREKYRLGLNMEVRIFLVWNTSDIETHGQNLVGHIIQDNDPYGQAPDCIDIDQVLGYAFPDERRLAELCNEWRSLVSASNLNIEVGVPEGLTWKQFKAIRECSSQKLPRDY